VRCQYRLAISCALRLSATLLAAIIYRPADLLRLNNDDLLCL
jgi:hypothetical protein